MFFNKPPYEKTGIEEAIDQALVDMRNYPAESDEYAKAVSQLAKLHEMKTLDKPKSINPDTVLIVSANLLGILLIVAYERANVIGSKALNFIFKLK